MTVKLYKPTTGPSVAQQITQWATANYDTSYAAQCVIESGGDQLAEYASLEDFLKGAAYTDEQYADHRAEADAMSGEDQ